MKPQRVTLADGKTIDVSFLKDRVVHINRWPWHSYDFDFTSLNLTMPHLRNPDGRFTTWRTDFVYADPAQAREFVDHTGVDMLAVAVGTGDLQMAHQRVHRGAPGPPVPVTGPAPE